MEEKDQLRLYSISGAARALSLGKDAVYRLVADGKLGYIQIGKRKKIPHRELVRFQSEIVRLETSGVRGQLMSKNEIDRFFNSRPRVKRNSKTIT